MNNFDNFTALNEGQLSDFWNGRYQQINLCNHKHWDNIPNISMDAT